MTETLASHLPETTQATSARGRFITFEGGEGAGKTTQIQRLAESLDALGIRVITTREPGGSPGAEIIRYLLLAGMGNLLGAEGEALLFAAARDDHVHHVIAPALEQGIWVLCDRFTDSTRVYQGKLGKVEPRLIEAMERVTIGHIKPDLTFVLDVPVDVGLARAAARRGNAAPDKFEAEGRPYHDKLRQAFQQVAQGDPQRCVLIDANRSERDVASDIYAIARERLGIAPAMADHG